MSKSDYIKKTHPNLKTRRIVKERDSIDGFVCCIFCGNAGTDLMHYKGKGSRGLGIEQNLAYGCRSCHMKLDQTGEGKRMKERFKQHLMNHYKNWNEEELIYRR